MEEGIKEQGMIAQIRREFGGGETDLRTYSPLTLAYIGDAVFEMIVRTVVVERGQCPASRLHRYTTTLVCASAQARMIESVYEMLTEEEQDIYRRGKNAKTHSSSKNSSLADYHKATGFEALCGHLFLKGETGRITVIVKQALTAVQDTAAGAAGSRNSKGPSSDNLCR